MSLDESWLPWIYVAIALPSSLILCFLTPPMQVPDEPTHLYRAYQLSELDMVGERQGSDSGSILPSSLHAFVDRTIGVRNSPASKTSIDEIFASAEIRLAPQERKFTAHHNSVRYPPTAHFAQAVGIAIGRLFDLPIVGLLISGRVANALFAVGLMTLAIALAPIGKLSIAVLGLCPMFVFMAGSLSADPGLIGSTAVFVALLMRSARDGAGVRARFGPLLAAAVFAGTSKLVYIVNTLVAIAVPGDEVGPLWRRRVFGILVAAIPIALLLIWLMAISDLVVPVGQDRGVDAGRQLSFALDEPLRVIGVLVGDLWVRAWEMMMGAIGMLGWLDTLFPKWFYVAFAIGFGLSLGVSGSDSKGLGLMLRVAALAAIVGVLMINQVIFYFTYTPVGADYVEGLQGRQLLPLIPMLILGLASPRTLSVAARSLLSWLILAGLAITQGYTIALVLGRFYVSS